MKSINPKNIVIERLSWDFNRGYTKAIQDIMRELEQLDDDLRHNKLRMNYKWVQKFLECFLANREYFRDDMGIGTGFIRTTFSNKGKRDCVEFYDPKRIKEAKKEVINILLDEMANQIVKDGGSDG